LHLVHYDAVDARWRPYLSALPAAPAPSNQRRYRSVGAGSGTEPLVAVDRSQAWFWTPEWQAGEREAFEQAWRGEGEQFENDADFLDSLR